MPIRLPKDAKHYDYEDQVCAALAAAGYYLETRLILRTENEEVLEFDALATPVKDHSNRCAVEIKSGRWGVPDIFKLCGQILYTDERRGWLIHKQPSAEQKRRAIDTVLKAVPVDVIHFDVGSQQELSIPFERGLELKDEVIWRVFVASWWARSASRVAQDRYRSWTKSFDPLPELVANARGYIDTIGESVFIKSPLDRVTALYDAYKDAPQLTSSLLQHAAEIGGHELTRIRSDVFNKSERYGLQFAAAQEHRARFAIIKNAYDAVLEAQARDDKRRPWGGLKLAFLPASFLQGLRALETVPYAAHVPYVLQVFVDVFGGYLFPGDDRELVAIADSTGVEPDQVLPAIQLMDEFFPIPGGWLHAGNGITFLKGVPAYQRGTGCFTREALYGEKWEAGFPRSEWWLGSWRNALHALLEPTLKVMEEDA